MLEGLKLANKVVRKGRHHAIKEPITSNYFKSVCSMVARPNTFKKDFEKTRDDYSRGFVEDKLQLYFLDINIISDIFFAFVINKTSH